MLVAGVALLLAVTACGAAAAPDRAGARAPVVATITVRAAVPPVAVVRAGRALVGIPVDQATTRRPEVLVSDDDGATWRTVRLPDAPDAIVLDPRALRRAAGLVVLSARGSAPVTNDVGTFVGAGGPVLAWTTRDGRTWRGGTVVAVGPPLDLQVVVAAARTLLLPVRETDGTVAIYHATPRSAWRRGVVQGMRVERGESDLVPDAWKGEGDLVGVLRAGTARDPFALREIRSRDGGRTWQREACPPTRAPCAPRLAARGLVLRGESVTVDGGKTWRPVQVVPRPRAREVPVRFTSVARVRGGWIATATILRGEDAVDLLLRSADGRTWRGMIDFRACRGEQADSFEVAKPVRADHGWYTVVSCGRAAEGTVRAWVARGDGSGRGWSAVPGTTGTAPLDPPLRQGRRVLVPQADDRGVHAILAITP